MDVTATAQFARPQYMSALARANEVRLARAELKRRVARGDVAVADVIRQYHWEAQSMPVGELLMSQNRWGQTRSRKLLALLPVSERKTVGSLTGRQRDVLAEALVRPRAHRGGRAHSEARSTATTLTPVVEEATEALTTSTGPVSRSYGRRRSRRG